jgi:uncharacterized damage-inducible protein DinB
MSETNNLAELMMAVVDGDPWHGPNVVSLLRGVDPEEAASHLVPSAHSIWELVLHMTGWADEVRSRLAGAEAGEPKAGDWPEVIDVSPAAWVRAREGLVASHERLAAALRATRDDQLEAPVVDRRSRSAGTGLSQYSTLHGLVHHTAYHAGQIALLVRFAESMR